MHKFEEPQLWGGPGAWRLGYQALGAIEHQGFMRIEREERTLGRDKACRIKHAVVDVFHFVIPPIIPAMVLCKDDMIQDRASLLSIDPQEDLGLRHACAESGKRDYSRPLLSEPCMPLSRHTAQAWSNAPGCVEDTACAGRGFNTVSPLA